MWAPLVAAFLLGTAAEKPTPATPAPQKGPQAPVQQKKRRTAPTPRQQPAPKDADRAKTAMA